MKFVSFRDEDVVEKYELSQELQSKMEQRLYIFKNNKWYGGIQSIDVLAKAYHLIGLRSFIKLSIVLGFGSKVYDYIANNRKLVPVGHCRGGVCEIPTKMKSSLSFFCTY